eukprot:TRINITY_DN4626_c0_g1_i4.p1 TRINITY_DN4626_c0_g1~~TRINITY_DN4626_c0_g1_i4.p1  ORF type:complete len:244 (+),score=33.40 TRINITY_DN4626_c0_g1_i4:51-782(+)
MQTPDPGPSPSTIHPEVHSDAPVCTFKKPVRGRNIRKRTSEAEDNANSSKDGDADEDGVNRSGLSQPEKKAASSRGIKMTPAKTAKLDSHSFESSDNVTASGDSLATHTLDIDGPQQTAKPDISNADGVYRGMSGYTSFVESKDTRQIKGLQGAKAGPVKGSGHIRISSRFDYQPDLCKDYKETGYCGFGDSCKFMHDRGDYKSGWQLEREWDEDQRIKREAKYVTRHRCHHGHLLIVFIILG